MSPVSLIARGSKGHLLHAITDAKFREDSLITRREHFLETPDDLAAHD